MGKILILAGCVFVIVGLILIFSPKIPFLGKLPGDIHIKRDLPVGRQGNFSFYFPITTCILISVILTIIFWLFKLFR